MNGSNKMKGNNTRQSVMFSIYFAFVSLLRSSLLSHALQLKPPTFFHTKLHHIQHILPRSTTPFQHSDSRLFLAGKGFDKSPSKPNPKSKKTIPTEDGDISSKQVQSSSSSSSSSSSQFDNGGELNAGQKALEKLRAQQQSVKDEELRKIRDVRSVDEFIRDDPTAAAIPEKVAMRMGNRMLPFVGIPLFGTMGAFVAFWYLRTYKNIEFETNVVAFTTIGLLAVGLLGITYSVMSASWDPDREGSTLGTEEFAENLDSIKQGLKRSRENLILREKMAGLPEEEIQAAIRALDERDDY